MTKPKRRKKKEAPAAICHGISYITYELDTVALEIAPMSDQELYEFALPHIEMYQHEQMDGLYAKVAVGNDLTHKERKSLEAFVMLANTEMGIYEKE